MNTGNDVTIKLGLDDSGVPPPVQRTNAAIASVGKTAEVSARQTAAAMRTLPAQFTDVATQLAGGQNPLLVLLQQGGQIKDSFGGIGPAMAGLRAAITPAAVGVSSLAVAATAFAVAAYQGRKESESLRDSIALSGNAAGLTGARFQAMAEQIAQATQQTVGGAKDIVMQLTASGAVGRRVLDSMAVAVGRVADVSGGDAKRIAADFASMSGGVARWAAEHNKAWNFITAEQYRYIRGLERQGRLEQAMLYVNQRITEHLADQQSNLGTLERAWGGVRKAASDAWNAMMGLGRERTTSQNLERAQKDLAIVQARIAMNEQAGTPDANPGDRAKAAELREQVMLLQRRSRLEIEAAERRANAAERERKAIQAAIAAEGAQGKGREDRGKPYIPGEFEVLDARDGQLLAARREKAESEREAFFAGVLRADAERQAQRLTGEAGFLQEMLEANQRAVAELIEGERQRGEALIALDLDIARRRVEARGLSGGARDEALRLVDEQGALARQRLEVDLRKASDKLAEDTGRELYEDTRSAISAAFRDSTNPLQAFGAALANTIYTRATASLVDALATAAVGANGRGGGLGSLINLIGSLASPYGGSSTNPSAPNYENSFDRLNPPPMATGTNYVPRTMVALLHEGEAVVPKRYNPAAGGGGGTFRITSAPQITIDARSDAQQVAGLVAGAVAEANAALVEDLQARGLIPS